MIRQTDPPVEPNEPTTIVARWLTTDHENARHLRESADEGGLSALRAEAEEYLQINASTDPTAIALLQWGRTHGPSHTTRFLLLTWTLDRVDWPSVAVRLGCVSKPIGHSSRFPRW